MSTSLPPRHRRGNSHVPPPTDLHPEPNKPIETDEALPIPDSFVLFTQAVLEQYVIHPYANMGSLHPEHIVSAIADSIAINGQELPIVYDQDGRIIDGRNRLIACAMVNIEPIFAQRTFETEGAVASFIEAVNLDTGERTVSQKVLWRVRLQYERDNSTSSKVSPLQRSERNIRITLRTDSKTTLNSQASRAKNARILVDAAINSTDESLKGEALRLIGEIQKGTSIEAAIKEWYLFNHVDHSHLNDKRFLYNHAPDLAEMVDLNQMELKKAIEASKTRDELARSKINAGKQASRTGLDDFVSNVNSILTAAATINEGIGCYPDDTPDSVLPTPAVIQRVKDAIGHLLDAYNKVHGE